MFFKIYEQRIYPHNPTMPSIIMYLCTIRGFPPKSALLKNKKLTKQHMTKWIQINIPKFHFIYNRNWHNGWYKEINDPRSHFKPYNQIIFNIITSILIPWKVAILVLKHLSNEFSIRKSKPISHFEKKNNKKTDFSIYLP